MRSPYKLVLPIENVEQFTENLARSPFNRQRNWLHYKVKSGDTMFSIAKKFSTTPDDIRKMNHLKRVSLYPGTNLLIPHSGEWQNEDEDDTADSNLLASAESDIKKAAVKINHKIKNVNNIISFVSKKETHYTLQSGDTIYMVRAKDTLEKIANHFHVSGQAIRMANKLSKQSLTNGEKIIIPTHSKALVQSSKHSSQKLQSGDTLYIVRRGDTIEKIAHKFKMSASALRLANLIDNHSLNEGQRLVVPTHVRG